MSEDGKTVWVDRGNVPVRQDGGISPGKWVALKTVDGDDERWTVCTAGPIHYQIATIENGVPGDTLETEALNARFIAASPEMAMALSSIAEELAMRRIEQPDESTVWMEVMARLADQVLVASGYKNSEERSDATK